MENWKFINANYEVSDKGNIKSVNYRGTGKSAIRKQSISKNGYMRVILSDNGKNKTYFVHRLVAAAFIPNPDNLPEIDHIDAMTIPRTPNGRAVYSFPDGNGIFIDAPETYYIVREPDGRLTTRPEREFNREFEPKGVSVPKEPGDKGCGNCANFTNEDVNGNGYCEAFKCEQSCGVMPCQEYKPKNQ